MFQHQTSSSLIGPRRLWLILLILVMAGPLQAQDNSLALVPKDAYFYQATLRCGEQWQAFVKSRAYARLKDMPAVQMAWQKVEEAWNSPFGFIVKNWYEEED